jgi:RHS repeat-associated protein
LKSSIERKNVALLLMGCLQLTYEKKSPLKIVHRSSAKTQKNGSSLYYYGARYYASWIARFVSVDPLQHEYPYYTPYQYAGNKPIIAIDLDGLESKNVIQEEETGQQMQPPQVLQDNLKEQQTPHVPELDAIWFKNEGW